jgi:hypothetical protein
MIERPFALIPFPAPNLPAIRITGSAALQEQVLALEYWLEGAIEEVLLPAVSSNPSRKDELWNATCFEFFLAVKARPEYWEFNMSPSGDWNVYRMDTYRRAGFRAETAIQDLPFQVQILPDVLQLRVAVELSPILQHAHNLDIGVTAVIQTNDGNTTYWALAHPAPQADFHLRESFTLELAAQTLPAQPSARDG